MKIKQSDAVIDSCNVYEPTPQPDKATARPLRIGYETVIVITKPSGEMIYDGKWGHCKLLDKYNIDKSDVIETLNAGRQHILPDGCLVESFQNVTISKSEHAALEAVAEAAQNYCENFFGNPTPNEKRMLKALATLSEIRKLREILKQNGAIRKDGAK
jgi:hypothetical protein